MTAMPIGLKRTKLNENSSPRLERVWRNCSTLSGHNLECTCPTTFFNEQDTHAPLFAYAPLLRFGSSRRVQPIRRSRLHADARLQQLPTVCHGWRPCAAVTRRAHGTGGP